MHNVVMEGIDIMKLTEYIYSHKLTLQEFAKSLGIDRRYLSAIINGKMPISDRVEYLIREKTEGKVSRDEIRKK